MISFSVTNATSEKAKTGLSSMFKLLADKSPSRREFLFAKIALDNEGKVFGIFGEEFTDYLHGNADCLCYKLTAFSLDDYGRFVPLATMNGELLTSEKSICFADRLDSVYENHGIGREMMLTWEQLAYECTEANYIDIIAINGEKNIPWYERCGYEVTQYFGLEMEIDPLTQNITKKAEGAFMRRDFTVLDYFKHKAAQKSISILRNAPEDVQSFRQKESERTQYLLGKSIQDRESGRKVEDNPFAFGNNLTQDALKTIEATGSPLLLKSPDEKKKRK